MKVTTASTRLAGVRSTPQPAQAQAAQEQQQPKQPPQQDEFQANSPDKHRVAYEAAYNFGSAVNNLTKAAAKTGQYAQLAGLALGLAPGGMAGTLGLIGGTYDVAIGASRAKQSAVNRNMTSTVSESLRVLQGVATFVSVLGPSFGAPGAVGTTAAFVAIGALAGRLGIQGVGAAKGMMSKGEEAEAAGAATQGALTQGMSGGSATVGAQAVIKQTEAEKSEEDKTNGDSRTFEKLFAATNAVDSLFQRLGGIGAFWNNIDAIRGNAPGGIWGIAGVVGSTYSTAQGAATLRASAINRNNAGTVDGTLHVIQGLASVGSSIGMGRPAGLVAAGAFVGRYAYQMYNQAQQLKGDEKEETVGKIVLDTVKNAFLGQQYSAAIS